jgi:hypothetical protein
VYIEGERGDREIKRGIERVRLRLEMSRERDRKGGREMG